MSGMKVLVTGAAGFIGNHLCDRLIRDDCQVIGVDNFDDYYDVQLKADRLRRLDSSNFSLVRLDIRDDAALRSLFSRNDIRVVLHLAARVGARHSVEHPRSYYETNITGFLNILECCRQYDVKHLIFASSSSVYGLNLPPFSLQQKTDSPLSPYAVTKKANELMAFNYAYLHDLRCTGVRLFTVYGPWGRPDMSYYSFARSILEGRPIDIYNYGKMSRDFTYIDDVIDILARLIFEQDSCPRREKSEGALRSIDRHVPFKLYNIGSNMPELVTRLISVLEEELGLKAIINRLPAQPGDVHATHADMTELRKDIIIKDGPGTLLQEGIRQFVHWYREYHRP